MLSSHLSKYILSGLLLSIFSTLEANVTVGIAVAMPMRPPVGVVIASPPEGYTSCYIVPPEWFENRYFPAHKECVYETGVIYSPGYWSYYNGAWVWMSGGWGGRHGYFRRGYDNHSHAAHGAYRGTGYVNHGHGEPHGRGGSHGHDEPHSNSGPSHGHDESHGRGGSHGHDELHSNGGSSHDHGESHGRGGAHGHDASYDRANRRG